MDWYCRLLRASVGRRSIDSLCSSTDTVRRLRTWWTVWLGRCDGKRHRLLRNCRVDAGTKPEMPNDANPKRWASLLRCRTKPEIASNINEFSLGWMLSSVPATYNVLLIWMVSDASNTIGFLLVFRRYSQRIWRFLLIRTGIEDIHVSNAISS